MFYSATQSLMIVQAQAQERANVGLGLPANVVDRQRQPRDRYCEPTRDPDPVRDRRRRAPGCLCHLA